MLRVIGNDIDIPRQEHAVASGALPNGQPIVVNANGTVSVVTQTSQTQAVGSTGTFETPASSGLFVMDVVYDSTNNKVVVVYKDGNNSSYGTAAVGTVSGTSISFGTPVVFESALIYSGSNENTHATHIGGKIVICYGDSGNGGHGTAVVGTVSGTSISFGTPVVFNAAATNEGGVCCTDTINNKVIIAYRDEGTSNYGTAKVGTVSGTSISFGSAAVFRSATVQALSIGFDPSTGVSIVGYRQPPWGGADCNILTVSGTSISVGSNVTFNAGSTTNINIIYDSNVQKMVFIYVDNNNSNKGTGRVGTVSGTSISFGDEFIFNDAVTSQLSATYDNNINRVVITYADSNTMSNFITATVSGDSLSFGTEGEFFDDPSGGIHFYSRLCFDTSTNKCIVAFRSDAGLGYASVITPEGSNTNLTSENYIGISTGPTDLTEAQTQAVGTPVAHYTTSLPAYHTATFDSNSNKVVVSFRGNGDDGTSVVGTVDSSNNSISFGSPVVWNTDESIYIKSTFDSNLNKVVVAYRDNGNSNRGTAVVGTVSGTSISFGTPVVFETGQVDHVDVTFDSSNNKVVIAYRDRDDSYYGKAIVGTVSGTSISFGSAVNFNTSGTTVYMGAVFDSNSNKVVVSWGNPGKAKVGTVSGTSISFGSEATFESGNIDMFSGTFDSSNNKVVYAYRDEGNSNYGTAVVGTVSGTSISFGTPVVFESAGVDGTGTVFDSNANKVNIFYEDAGNSAYGTVIVGTVSGTSISFGSPTVFQTATTGQFAATFDSNSNRTIGAYSNEGTSKGTSVVFRNAGNYPVTGQVADGGHVLVDTQGGIADNLSGLTAGQSYYVQADATLDTTADDLNVFAGTAVSATKLIVKG